jgi:hypothetical protein
MPDKVFLRIGLVRSDRYHALSLDGRDLFIRLLVITDDFGCFDGREHVIAHTAYFHGRHEALPLRELHENDLIVRYTNAGKPFLAITQWGESLRLRRLFPAPPVNTDQPDVNVRGKFGRPINWKNPPGTDAVSVLIDVNGRAVAPQPPEWRRVTGDWMPIGVAAQPVRTPRPQSLQQGTEDVSNLQPLPAATTGPSTLQHQDHSTGRNVVPVPIPLPFKSPTPQTPEPSALPQRLATASATNGKIELTESGEWRGLTDARRLQWQDMFADLSIPDQLDRAGQWLLAHPAEREAYTRDEGGLDAYLIRWLLREAKPVKH